VLSQVPVPRLLEGVAAALETYVEPHVDDRFARMQLRAIDELLRNLAERVDWSAVEIGQEADDIERVLAAFESAGWRGDGDHVAPAAGQPAGASAEEAASRRSGALAALRQALAWVEAGPAKSGSEAVVAARSDAIELLREDNARERARLKSGMYS
jgi:hypothetical protein